MVPLGTRLRTAGRVRVHGAPLHLDGARAEAPSDEALALAVQPRNGIQVAAVLAVGVEKPGPPDFGRGGRTGPSQRVEVLGVDRLGPKGHLAADNVLGCGGVEPVCWVVGVEKLPALSWSTPVGEPGGRLSNDIRSPCDPLATAAVEILC